VLIIFIKMIAVLILDEPFTWIAAIGTLFTLGGVLLSEGKIKLKKH